MDSLQCPVKPSFSVGKIGYGLMNFTWTPKHIPDEQAFAAILASLEGGGTYLDAGEFYGNPDDVYAGLTLLARFFEKYPEWAAPGKCFLSVKGSLRIENGQPKSADGSEAGLRKSVDNINAKLGGRKKMDLFQMARVDQTIPIEETVKTLAKLIQEGKFTHIGLSEVSANTIKKAHNVHHVAAVEVEYSMWALDIEQNSVLSTCKELGIPVIAYCPLGRGMLTGSIKSYKDIPEGDLRHHLDRFQPENFDQNLKLVNEIQSLAKAKGCTSAELAIAWLLAQGVIPIPGSTRVEGVKESLNAVNVHLSDDDLRAIRKVVDSAEVKGGRYNDHMAAGLAV